MRTNCRDSGASASSGDACRTVHISGVLDTVLYLKDNIYTEKQSDSKWLRFDSMTSAGSKFTESCFRYFNGKFLFIICN